MTHMEYSGLWWQQLLSEWDLIVLMFEESSTGAHLLMLKHNCKKQVASQRLRTSMAYATTPSPLVSLGADESLLCPSKCRSTYLSTNAPVAISKTCFRSDAGTCVIQWGMLLVGWLTVNTVLSKQCHCC